MARILVGLDGSAASSRALRWALEQAQLRGDSAVVAVHAYRIPGARPNYAYTESYLPAGALERRVEQERTLRAEEESTARERAEGLIEHAILAEGEAAEGQVIKRVVAEGDAAKTLIEMSRGVDLLVVGSRGIGGFKGLLVGSVSQQCLHHAHCPVVVVR